MFGKKDEPDTEETDQEYENTLNELTEKLSKFNWKDGVTERARLLMYSNDVSENIKGVLSLKAMLSIGINEVYEVAQEVIDSGVISRLVGFLKVCNKELQAPAAFCLTNIAAGLDYQTQSVVEAGAIEPLIDLLRHPERQLKRQAIFCLSNIAGSTPSYRILLARHPRYFSSLISAVENPFPCIKLVDLVCWNLRNICSLGGPTLLDIQPALIFLVNKILKPFGNVDVLFSSSIGFAMEAVNVVSRSVEGRNFLRELFVFECILSILATWRSPAILKSSFESVAWFLSDYSDKMSREQFMNETQVISKYVNEAIPGSFGLLTQEFALKAFCFVSSPINRENLEQSLWESAQIEDLAKYSNQYPYSSSLYEHLDACIFGKIFLEVGSLSLECSEYDEGFTDSSNIDRKKSIRMYSGLLFCRCLCLMNKLHRIKNEILSNYDIIDILIQAIEVAALNEDIASELPAYPDLARSTVFEGLKALLIYVKEVAALCRENGVSESPILPILEEIDACNRIALAFQKFRNDRTIESLVQRIMQELSFFRYGATTM